MATVDLAIRREGTFVRLHAIKRLHPHLLEDPDVRAMFIEEARIAGLLRHPNIVSVVDVGEDAAGPFLVMDYVEGVSVAALIEDAIETAQLVPVDVALRIAIDVAKGLHAAHELTAPDGVSLSLVHRDVSPQNVLVGFDGVARVTDFGIAKALGRGARTSTGILKGKLGYMAPEQLQFKGQDRRSDLFAFGVVLFELLTSRRLYPGQRGEESARRILEEPPPDLTDDRDDAPPALVGLLFKLLAKRSEHRPPDAQSVARVLEDVLMEVSAASAAVDTAQYLEGKFGERRREMQQALSLALTEEQAVGSTPRPRRRRLMAAGAALATAIVGVAVWRSAEPTPPPSIASARAPLQAAANVATEFVETARTTPTAASVKRASPASRPTRARVERKRAANREAGDVRLWEWQ
jgi:serine/threonine-protein kinase